MSEQEKRWPVGGYAPGGYAGCKCNSCGEYFVAAKRAYTCADCIILVLLDAIDYLEAKIAGGEMAEGERWTDCITPYEKEKSDE